MLFKKFLPNYHNLVILETKKNKLRVGHVYIDICLRAYILKMSSCKEKINFILYLKAEYLSQ